jgi:prepilin-type N-terminal cleavage/methylation domain-containing protein
MKKQKGFTLVELLVVIAIIGILAAILLPSLGSAKTRSLRAKAQSTISQLSQAIKAYQMDWGVYIPDGQGHINGNTNLNDRSQPQFGYTATALVAYLDGESTTIVDDGCNCGNGAGRIQYYEFSPKDLFNQNNQNDPINGTIFADPFGSYYMYHNFANAFNNNKPPRPDKNIGNPPMHPNSAIINSRSFQIFTEANFPLIQNDPNNQHYPYGGLENHSIDTFRWITNYSN